MNDPLTQTDAATMLLSWLRSPNHGGFGSYGYGIYLPHLVRAHLAARGVERDQEERQLREMMPMLYAAAWDLCRRGVLRPGIERYGAQATPDGASGNGYSVTPFGAKWIAETNQDDFVPTEPERFGEMLGRYRNRFGGDFHERGRQSPRQGTKQWCRRHTAGPLGAVGWRT